MSKLTLSASQIGMWTSCRMKHYWTYHENLTPTGDSEALIVGNIVHKILDRFHRGELQADDLGKLDEKVAEWYPQLHKEEAMEYALIAAGLFRAWYTEYGTSEDFSFMGSETHLEKDFGDFILYSRIDALYQSQDERLWRAEHKSTSRTDSAYLGGIKNRLQTGIALWLLDELVDQKVYGTIFNLLIKTKIPAAKRSVDMRQDWVVDFVKQLVPRVAQEILSEDFYPSLRCFSYGRDCEFQPLCRNDTPATREALYTNREEVKQQDKAKVW